MDADEIKNNLELNSDNISDLIFKIKEGDKASFKEFFILMHPHIYSFLYRYTCDKPAAEDIAQDTFVQFWIHRQQLDLNLSPKAYLFKIAKNLAINYMNKNRSFPESRTIKDKSILSVFNPEDSYDQNFLFDEFQKAINHLPKRCRATFILCKYEGFNYSEAAEILNVSLQTVKNQMNKAISILKKLLASHLS